MPDVRLTPQTDNTETTINVDIQVDTPQPYRILSYCNYYDTDGEWCESYEPMQVLPVDDFTPNGILKAMNENMASYLSYDVSESDIQSWLNDPEYDLPVATTPYVQCANSDDFEGTVEIMIRHETFESYVAIKASSFQSQVMQFTTSQ